MVINHISAHYILFEIINKMLYVKKRTDFSDGNKPFSLSQRFEIRMREFFFIPLMFACAGLLYLFRR